MAKDASKTGSQRPARGAVRSRRDLLARQRRGMVELLGTFLRSPSLGWGTLTWALFIVICASIAAWSRQQPVVAVGRVANETAVARMDFDVEDPEQTRQLRLLEEKKTPRVYAANPNVLESIRGSIESLPRTLAAVDNPGEVIPQVAQQFPVLTPEGLAAIKAEATEGEVSEGWKSRVKTLHELLLLNPIVSEVDYQRDRAEGLSSEIELRFAEAITDTPRRTVRADQLLSAKSDKLPEVLRRMARDAGFRGATLDTVVSRLAAEAQPTFQFDERATQESQRAAAARVAPVMTKVGHGDVLFKRGDVLKAGQLALFKLELMNFQRSPEQRWRVWVRAASVLGAVTAIALAMAGYLVVFAPRVRHSPQRMLTIAFLLSSSLGVACAGTVWNPALLMLTAIAPTVFIAVVLVIGYDRRVALALGTLHGVLVCIALDQPIGVYALILTGISFAVVQLYEIRDRRGIIRMGLTTGAALAVGTLLVALIDRPIVTEVMMQTLPDAALAGLGGLGVGVLALALLPAIERTFEVTTGMTLIELRDPKQPLLRQLQQRAPGTYNHSLNVASIAESAADAIKADALLTYVGSLYHDIGKMNKPEYFVENQ
ncbi:MAG: HDIG domain-containing metalloprotein, partial [Phycisphaerales bacterium]